MNNGRLDARWVSHLDETATAVRYPATPDLSDDVMATIRTDRVRPHAAHGWPARFAAAAVLALFILAATIAVPSARTAVGEFFGLVEGERIEVLPDPPPGVSPTVRPTPPPLADLGTRFTLDQLQAAIGFPPALPEGGPPNAMFLVNYEGLRIAVLQYEQYDLWQTKTTGYGYFNKGVPPATAIETPRIGDTFGYWISGGGRVVRFVNDDGDEVIGSQRTVDRNTLIWRDVDSGVFYRLETSLSLDQALAIVQQLP